MKKFSLFVLAYLISYATITGMVFLIYFALSKFINFTFIENFLHCDMYTLIEILVFIFTSYRLLTNWKSLSQKMNELLEK